MKRNFVPKLAFLSSYLFSPATLLPIIVLVSLAKSSISWSEMRFALLILFGFGLMPMIVAIVFLKQMGKVSDWDITDRRERPLVYLILLLIIGLLYLIISPTGISLVSQSILLLFLWFALHTAITFFWKISAHSGSVTLFYLMLIHYFGIGLAWWLILIPLVSWSRVYRNKHTLSQVIGGVILSTFIYYIAQVAKII